MNKELAALDRITQHFQKRHTDLSGHMATLFIVCLEHLKNFNGNVIVELTVNTGESTFVFNEIAQIIPITLIGLNSDPNYIKVYDQLPINVNHYFYNMDEITYSRKHVSECSDHKIKSQIDILWIDSAHYYDVTLKRLENFVPLLANDGMIIFHDTYMAPIVSTLYGRGWEISKGQIMYGGWDNQRGVTRAIEDFFHILINEEKNFSYVFFHNGNFWSIYHEYMCNGLTILKKLNLLLDSPHTSKNSKTQKNCDCNILPDNQSNNVIDRDVQNQSDSNISLQNQSKIIQNAPNPLDENIPILTINDQYYLFGHNIPSN